MSSLVSEVKITAHLHVAPLSKGEKNISSIPTVNRGSIKVFRPYFLRKNYASSIWCLDELSKIVLFHLGTLISIDKSVSKSKFDLRRHWERVKNLVRKVL